MERSVNVRLRIMCKRVDEELLVCRGLVEKFKREEHVDPEDEIHFAKLKQSVARLVNEVQMILQGSELSEGLELLIEELTNKQIEAEDTIVELDVRFDRNKREKEHDLKPMQSVQSHGITSRLPKLDMPKYDGNILRWHEFWDRFSSMIANKPGIHDVDKLAYLQSLLEGEAKRAIDGLDITGVNYCVVVDRLKERFGKKGILIDAHYVALQQIPTANSNDINSCRLTLDEIERHLRTLKALGEDVSHRQLRASILNKFPNDIIFDMRMTMTSDDEPVEEIRTNLEKIISARETSMQKTMITNDVGPSNSNFTTEIFHSSGSQRSRKRRGEFVKNPKFLKSGSYITAAMNHGNRHYSNNQKYNYQPQNTGPQNKQRKLSVRCAFCGGDHPNEKCIKYQTVSERKQKAQGLCYICLKKGHFMRNCKLRSYVCVHCNRKNHHHQSLCPKLFSKDGIETNTFHSQSNDYNTLLQTVMAQIISDNGKSIQGRILFDTGSQRSYINSALARKLKVTIIENTCLTVFTFGTLEPKTIQAASVNLKINVPGGPKEIMAYVVPSTTGKLPSYSELRQNIEQSLPEYQITADSENDCPADIIVGNDYYYNFIMPERKEISPNLYLIKTDFGWMPSGCCRTNDIHQYQLTVVTYVQGNNSCKWCGEDLFISPDPAILREDNSQTLWELEVIGIKDSPKITQDEEAVEFFNKTTKFYNQRYHVKWPWVEYPPNISPNFGLAVGRLRSLVKRSSDDTLQKYDAVLKEQMENEMIETVNETRIPNSHPVHYLPHHCVLKENKTTKLRIVYDGSAKVKGQFSLNELLYKGPSMLEDLTTLLIQFRLHRVALTADIEKAFLQVGLQDEDRDVTRFLWLKDIKKEPADDNLLHLRFCRVPFGILCSPFLLAATIRFHLNNSDNLLGKKLAHQIYVDNLVTGAHSIEEAKKLYTASRQLFGELSMNIREWNSNSTEFLQFVPQQHKTDQTSTTTILGLNWNTHNDSLNLAMKPEGLEEEIVTKRHVLRLIASVFDPCGWTAPLTLPTRIFLQQLWKDKMKWDDPLSKDQIEQWRSCTKLLRLIPTVSIPRFLLIHNEDIHLSDAQNEIHCFTDASKAAYVAVVYIRCTFQNKYFVRLVISKSRLTPLKQETTLTIPKLELLAVLIGTRLINYVKDSLELRWSSINLWTDSTIVLRWLKSQRLLPPFVNKRINEIVKSSHIQFRHVPSQQNPADVATRGQNDDVLPDIWLDGPLFLHSSDEQWHLHGIGNDSRLPNYVMPAITSDSTLQLQTDHEPTTSSNQGEATTAPLDPEILKYSSNLDIAPIKIIQARYYPQESTGQSSSLTKSLGLYLDSDSIIRCKGRFANSSIPQRYPILLPKESPSTFNLIQRIHKDNYHVGVSHTLSLLREQFWVPQGRSLVTKALQRCQSCLKHGGGPYKMPPMPDLPSERSTYSPPFTNTGLDYFGPLTVSGHTGIEKRWCCLFTCMAVRSIHIEVVKDLSAEEFLMCLRRFIAIRGTPKLIVSDNAAHFKLSAAILASPEATRHNLRWHFITELSPWQGGFYERLIGIIKNCLRRTLGRSLLNETQLSTVLHEVASLLNTRPLTTVGSSLEQVLTPAHFLNASGPSVLIDPDITTDATQTSSNIRNRIISSWKRTRTVRRDFEHMFVNQYLTGLRERHFPYLKQPRVLSRRQPKIGDAVQIKGESANRNTWRVGRLTDLLTSQDGAVRSAHVKLNDGTVLHRSMSHIYPLELDLADNQPLPLSHPPDASRPTSLEDRNRVLPPHTPISTTTQDSVNQSHPALPHAPTTSDSSSGSRRPREAARLARQNIRQWTRALFSVAALHRGYSTH